MNKYASKLQNLCSQVLKVAEEKGLGGGLLVAGGAATAVGAQAKGMYHLKKIIDSASLRKPLRWTPTNRFIHAEKLMKSVKLRNAGIGVAAVGGVGLLADKLMRNRKGK